MTYFVTYVLILSVSCRFFVLHMFAMLTITGLEEKKTYQQEIKDQDQKLRDRGMLYNGVV